MRRCFRVSNGSFRGIPPPSGRRTKPRSQVLSEVFEQNGRLQRVFPSWNSHPTFSLGEQVWTDLTREFLLRLFDFDFRLD
jgi:hypothetical protein